MKNKGLLTGLVIFTSLSSAIAQPSTWETIRQKNAKKTSFQQNRSTNQNKLQRPTADSVFFRPIARTNAYMNSGQYIPSDSNRYFWHKYEGKNFYAATHQTDVFDPRHYLTNFVNYNILENDVFSDHFKTDSVQMYYYDINSFEFDATITNTYNNQDQITFATDGDIEVLYRYDNNGNLAFRGAYYNSVLVFADSATYNSNGQPLTQLNFDGSEQYFYEYTYNANNKIATYTSYNKSINDNFLTKQDETRNSFYYLPGSKDSITIAYYDNSSNTFETETVLLDYKNSANLSDSVIVYDVYSATYITTLKVEYNAQNEPISGILGNITDGEYNKVRFYYNNQNSYQGYFVTYIEESSNLETDYYKEEYTFDNNNNIINAKSYQSPTNDSNNWETLDYDYNVDVYYEEVTIEDENPNSIPKLDAQTIILYPNPSADKINIQTQEEVINELQIFDAMGRLVFSKKMTQKSNNVNININNLASGSYIINIQTDKGLGIKKFTKN